MHVDEPASPQRDRSRRSPAGRLPLVPPSTETMRSPRMATSPRNRELTGPVDDLAAADQEVERLLDLGVCECGIDGK